MQTSTKWVLGGGIVAATLLILAHGVVVPKSLWQPTVDKLNEQFPSQAFSADRVVVGLSHKPHVIISNANAISEKHGENLSIGLTTIELNGWQSLLQQRAVVEKIEVKQLKAERTVDEGCHVADYRCLPRSVAAALGGLWANWEKLPAQPKLDLAGVLVEQASFTTQSPKGEMGLVIDKLSFQKNETFQAGARWKTKGYEEVLPTDATFAFNATPDGQGDKLNLGKLNTTITAMWKGYPWKTEASMDLLALSLERLESGLPKIDFASKAFRSYVSRQDDPALHQAAFSSVSIEGALPSQTVTFAGAEWTYTQEDAKAWTFDMQLHADNGLIEITPATLEGSEGEPAESQKRLLNCHQDTGGDKLLGLIGTSTYSQAKQIARTDKPFWLWKDGWFDIQMRLPTDTPTAHTADLIVCPVL